MRFTARRTADFAQSNPSALNALQCLCNPAQIAVAVWPADHPFERYDLLFPACAVYQPGVVKLSYKDLRAFIRHVEDLRVLPHIKGADSRFEIGGITEVAAGTPECQHSSLIASGFSAAFAYLRMRPQHRNALRSRLASIPISNRSMHSKRGWRSVQRSRYKSRS